MSLYRCCCAHAPSTYGSTDIEPAVQVGCPGIKGIRAHPVNKRKFNMAPQIQPRNFPLIEIESNVFCFIQSYEFISHIILGTKLERKEKRKRIGDLSSDMFTNNNYKVWFNIGIFLKFYSSSETMKSQNVRSN